MYSHSFRNSVVSSTLTLPVAAVGVLVLWMLPAVADGLLWGGLAVTGLTTYVVMELNARNALLRIRSRLMSVTYLVLMLVCPFLHGWSPAALSALCFALGHATLFASYQQTRPEAYVFHTFLFAGIGSLAFPPLLVVAVGYYFSMLFQLRNLTGRSFVAGLLGLLLPYWLHAAHAIWHNRLDTAFLPLLEQLRPRIPDYASVPAGRWVTLGVVGFFALLAFIHFFHTAYNDKIRTRMMFYVIATQEVLLAAGFGLLPHCFDALLRLFLVNSSLLIAHYFALGRGRFFNAWFNVSLLLLAALGVYNYFFA